VGASPRVIMAVTGHKSLSEVQKYAAEYNRRQAADAAMALLLKTGTELQNSPTRFYNQRNFFLNINDRQFGWQSHRGYKILS
jgi:hypothetical protein